MFVMLATFLECFLSKMFFSYGLEKAFSLNDIFQKQIFKKELHISKTRTPDFLKISDLRLILLLYQKYQLMKIEITHLH